MEKKHLHGLHIFVDNHFSYTTINALSMEIFFEIAKGFSEVRKRFVEKYTSKEEMKVMVNRIVILGINLIENITS